MPSNARPLRSAGALRIVPVTTPVPWGTSANPANVPMPRGDEEWGRAANPPDPDDVARLERAELRYGHGRMTDMLGNGYDRPCDLSDYSAWMALSVVEFADQLMDVQERTEHERVVNVAGAHYRARPVKACATCEQETPHYVSVEITMCLVCGSRA